MGAVITEPVLEQVFGLMLEKVIEEATCKRPQERRPGGVVCTCEEHYGQRFKEGHGYYCDGWEVGMKFHHWDLDGEPRPVDEQ